MFSLTLKFTSLFPNLEITVARFPKPSLPDRLVQAIRSPELLRCVAYPARTYTPGTDRYRPQCIGVVHHAATTDENTALCDVVPLLVPIGATRLPDRPGSPSKIAQMQIQEWDSKPVNHRLTHYIHPSWEYSNHRSPERVHHEAPHPPICHQCRSRIQPRALLRFYFPALSMINQDKSDAIPQHG